MKSFYLLAALFTGANAFGVSTSYSRPQSVLNALIDEAEMTSDQLEIEKIQEKWTEVRMMSKEEAESLEPEWKEAYDRFYEKYHSDMESMTEIATRVKKMIEPPKVEKKSKGQRKRDAWAKVQAREAARAATN